MQAVTGRPRSALRTVIGYPAPEPDGHRQGARRGAPATTRWPQSRRSSAFDPDKTFQVREDVLTHTRGLVAPRNRPTNAGSSNSMPGRRVEPERKAPLDRLLAQKARRLGRRSFPLGTGSKALATRAARVVLSALGPKPPELWAVRPTWRAATTQR